MYGAVTISTIYR